MKETFLKQLKQFRKALKTSFFVSPFLFFVYVLSLLWSSISEKLPGPEFLSRYTDVFFEWMLHNEGYVFFIFLTIALDHLLGTIKYLFKREFSIKKNIAGLFLKLFITIVGAVLFEAMNQIADRDSMIKDYLVIMTRLLVFFYPARSAFRNMSELTKGVFPPKSWITKMDNFNVNLDVKEFTKGDDKKD